MEERLGSLRVMKICRFCLTEKDPLSNIYDRDNKNAIPLPLQIMACVTIEVFVNDGMPQLICDDCRLQTRKSYSFKTMCKKSDDALKLYLATGVLTRHEKEDILKSILVQKRNNESEIQAPAQKRLKSNNLTVIETDQLKQVGRTEIIRSEEIKSELNINDQRNDYEPEPFISEVTEEFPEEYHEVIVEQGEIKQIEQQPSPPKQVMTHCFSCDHCERSFPLQQLLDIHMRQHTRERKFACFTCLKKFFSKHDLMKHVHTHSGEKPFNCVVCNKSFSRATLLHRHEKIHVSEPKYLCSYCDKTYLNLNDFDAHITMHKKKRPFKCEYCDKSFAFKQGLERHEVIHNNENAYKCDYCDESYNTPAKLARHVTSHAGARPFPCKLCPRTFLLSHHLTRHLRNHYNRKAKENDYGYFKCDTCSMSFRRKDSLINHTAIHSMVNLKCVICNKEFSDAKTVKNHVSTHLAGLPYPCDKCDYSFETQEELEDHEVKHADDEDDEEEDEYILENDSLQIVQSELDGQPHIRRSQRESKIKNYAEFLKDELGSDSEEEREEPEEVRPETPKQQVSTIQPVIRSETMKMYKGGKDKTDKNIIEQKYSSPVPVETPQIQENKEPPKTPELPRLEPAPKSVTKITTLENLGISKQTLDAMTDKSGFVEMKLGQKVIRVQKLMMTKSEYQAMSKRTKLEMKGSTVVVQNIEGGLDLKKLTQLTRGANDPLSENSKFSETHVSNQPNVDFHVSKTPVRTYVKKSVIKKEDLPQGNQITEELSKGIVTISNNIDLSNATDESATLKEAELLGRY